MPRPIETLTFKSFFGMVLAAASGGFVIAVPAILIGSRLFAENSLGGFEDLVGAIVGMVIGYPAGVIVGIYVYSRVFRYRGSMWLAVLGAVLGVVLVFGLAEPLNLNVNSDLLLGGYFLITALLATWGFHLKKI